MKANQIFTIRRTGSGAVSELWNLASFLTTDADEGASIVSIMFHLSAAGGATENFVARVLYDGTTPDYVMVQEDTNTATDIGWTPPKSWPLLKNDRVQFTYANTNSRDWTLRIIYEKADHQEMNT